MASPLETFASPDDFGPITASDIYRTEHLRMITDAHSFLVPLILLAAAIVLWLTVRFVFGGAITRLRRFASLWFEAKESELRARAGKRNATA
jgi:hypothetical protein